MSVDVKQPRSRRALLAGLAGAAGALATGAIHRLPVVRAADGGNALLGTANTSTIVTSFENTDASESSLKGYHGADGNGVEAAVGGAGHGLHATAAATGGRAIFASSLDKAGITGYSTSTSPTHVAGSENSGVIGVAGDASTLATRDLDENGVYGFCDTSTFGSGVFGESVQGVGVFGLGQTGIVGTGEFGLFGPVGATGIGGYGSASAVGAPSVFGGAGLIGQSDAKTGVLGFTGPTAPALAGYCGVYGVAQAGGTVGRGVYGYAPTGVGLQGQTASGTGVKALATTTGTALSVQGKAAFSRSGKITLAAGHSSVVKGSIPLTSSSFVLATLQTNVAGLSIQSVVTNRPEAPSRSS